MICTRPTSAARVALALIAAATILLTVAVQSAHAIAPPTTYTVNSDADPGDGTCDVAQCTLREAITAANLNSGADQIVFDANSLFGVYNISPASPLPSIAEAVTITNGGATNVTLDGSNAGAGANGLSVAAASTVDGIFVQDFSGAGIALTGGTSTLLNDSSELNGTGIALTGGSGHTIKADTVGSNIGDGIAIGAGSSNDVIGDANGPNYINNGNGGAGISVASSGNAIAWNVVDGNDGDGVRVTAGTGNAISHNSIDVNGGLGIDLGDDGVTANDSLDADTGPNGLQNFPVLTSVTYDSSTGDTTIAGTLDAKANTSYDVDFYETPTCDASGNGEGATYIDTKTVVTDGSGHATVSATRTGAPPDKFVATATDPSNNTSEFSACAASSQQLHQLSVSIFGSGTGTVTSTPAGISCPSTSCSADFEEGSSVTLHAEPATGQTFDGWSGDCSGTADCNVTMDAGHDVQANFSDTNASNQPLDVTKSGNGTGTVTSTPAGINCGATCSASFTTGSTVTLHAAADTGYNFAGWSGGGCTGTADCVVTMDQSQQVDAQFTDPNFALNLAKAMTRDISWITGANLVQPPNGTPNAVGTTALDGYPTHGPTYAIMTSGDATQAAAGGNPDNYAGGSNVRGDTDFDVSILRIDLNVPAAANCLTLDFRFLSEEWPTFVGSSFNDGFIAELDTSDWTTSGSTITAPHNFAFDPNGDVVSINSTGETAMNAANAAGTSYGGATAPLHASKVITPGAHSVYLSIFDQGDHALDSAAFLDNLTLSTRDAAACVSGATSDTTPPALTLVTPANGSSTGDPTPTFSGAAGTAAGDLNTIMVKIYSGNSATGDPVQTLTTTRSGGSWTVDPTTPLAPGTYTAKAEQSDDAGNTGFSSANTFTVTAGGVVQRQLSVSKSGGGSGTVTSSPAGIDCGSTCQASFDDGTSVTLTATPAAGSTFTGWSGDCSGNSCTVSMTAARSVTANFAKIQRQLSVSKSGGGSGTVTSDPAGINCGSTCQASYDDGTSVTLTATPAAGSTFTGWSGECTGNSCTVSMTAARSVTANFAPIQRDLTVSKSGGGSGTVTSSPAGINCGATCQATYVHGTSVTLSASPAAGSTFTGWGGACSGTGGCTVTMDAAKSVTASFAKIQRQLSVSKSGSGSGSVSSSPSGIDCGATCQASYDDGTLVTLTATPASGSTFTGWGGACSGTANCTVTMDAAKSATAEFTAQPPPAPPTASVSDVKIAEGDSGTSNATFSVSLSKAASQAVTVNYATVEQTAKAKDDFVAASSSVTFAAGQTTKPVAVAVVGDLLKEPTETFQLKLTGATGAGIAGGTGVATVTDDDVCDAIATPGKLLTGTPGDDVLCGSSGDDRIYGDGGDDLLLGKGGDDILHGEDGKDHLVGGPGDDFLRAGAGKDELDGGAGDDLLDGNLGNDNVDGGKGAKDLAWYLNTDKPVTINLATGSATGGLGTDVLDNVESAHGGDGDDKITGDTHDNGFAGGLGDDKLFGGGGDDDISGGKGDDTEEGQGGDDTLVGGPGTDSLDGGKGSDGCYLGEMKTSCEKP